MIFLSLMLLVAYSFACLSLGLVLLRGFVGREAMQTAHAPSARVASGFLLGGGVLATLWLCILLLPGRWFTLPVVGSLVLLASVVGAIPAVRALGHVVRQFARAMRNTFRNHWLWGVLAVAGLVFPILYALTASLPPRGDAVAFYFAFPKLLAYEGVLRPLPGFEFFSQLGLQGEMHVSVLILLGSWQSASFFSGFIGVATVMMLIEIARQAGIGPFGRWTVLILAYTSTAFVYLTFAGRLDLFGVSLTLAAVYWALCRPLRPGLLVMIGMLGCFGVLAKATYALTTVPMLVVLLWWRSAISSTNHSGRAVFRALAFCAAGAVLAVIPHVIKNAILYGPEYSLAPFLVPSDGYQWSQTKICTDAQALHILRIYPIALFLGQSNGIFGTLSPAALAIWPLALLLPRPKRWAESTLVQLAVIGVVGVAFFALLQTWNFSLRYFLPPLLLLFLVPSAAAEYVWREPCIRRWLKVGLAVVLVMALAERFNRPKGHVGDGLKYILGRASKVEVGETSDRMFHVVNEIAPSNARVFLATRCVFPLRADLIAKSSSSDERQAVGAAPSAEERWRKCYLDGFRFICFQCPVAGRMNYRERSFTTYSEYGNLQSNALPDELELICRYWGPDDSEPNTLAVFELRPRQNE